MIQKRLFRFGSLWWLKNKYHFREAKNEVHPCAFTIFETVATQQHIGHIVPGTSTFPEECMSSEYLDIPYTEALRAGLTNQTYLLIRMETPVPIVAIEERNYIGELSEKWKQKLMELLLHYQQEKFLGNW